MPDFEEFAGLRRQDIEKFVGDEPRTVRAIEELQRLATEALPELVAAVAEDVEDANLSIDTLDDRLDIIEDAIDDGIMQIQDEGGAAADAFTLNFVGAGVAAAVAAGVATVTIPGAAAAALVLLEQHTASASPSLDFTTAISSAYDTYLIEFVDVVPASDNVNLLMRMSTNAGVSYDNSALYDFAGNQTHQGTFTGAINGGASATSGLIVQGVDNAASNSVCGELKLYGPGGSLFKKVVGETATQKNDTNFYFTSCGGRYRNTTPVNAFQFFFSTGNIASGTIRVYGIAKS